MQHRALCQQLEPRLGFLVLGRGGLGHKQAVPLFGGGHQAFGLCFGKLPDNFV